MWQMERNLHPLKQMCGTIDPSLVQHGGDHWCRAMPLEHILQVLSNNQYV